jgi:hypothetical protein
LYVSANIGIEHRIKRNFPIDALIGRVPKSGARGEECPPWRSRLPGQLATGEAPGPLHTLAATYDGAWAGKAHEAGSWRFPDAGFKIS